MVGMKRRSLARLAALVPVLMLARPAAAHEAPAPSNRIGSDDKLKILELFAHYAWAYDTSDAEGFAQTFTTDGVLEIFGNEIMTDPTLASEFMAMAAGMRGEHGWQHLTDHHVFRDYDGGSCTVFSYYTMTEADLQGANGNVRAIGYYRTHCVRHGDDWLIKRRSVHRWDGKAPFTLNR